MSLRITFLVFGGTTLIHLSSSAKRIKSTYDTLD
jgi:hypothetical protein